MQDQTNTINQLSLKDILVKYKKYLPWLILSVLVALACAFLYLRYSGKTYSSTGALLLKNSSDKLSKDKFSALFGGDKASDDLQNEIEIIKSIPVLTRVVERMGLNFNYYAVGKIKKQVNIYKDGPFLIKAFSIADSTYPFALNIRFEGEGKFSINNQPETYLMGQAFKTASGSFILEKNNTTLPEKGANYIISWQPAENVAEALVWGLTVVPKAAGGSIISIKMESANAGLAADFVNNLIAQYDSMNIEELSLENDLMKDFVWQSIESLKPEIDSLRRKEEYLQQHYNPYNAEANTKYYFDKMSESGKLMNEQQSKYENINLIAKYLQNNRNKYQNVSPSALEIEDPQLLILLNNYNEAQAERINLLKNNVGENNNLVKAAEAGIENSRSKILELLNNIESSTAKKIKTFEGLYHSSAQKEGTLSSNMPLYLLKLEEIKRQASVKLSLYTLLEEKNIDLSLSKAATRSNIKVIQRAKRNNIPVKPSPKVIFIIALFAGLAIPAGIVFLKELLNDKVSDQNDITSVTQAPILGEVFHSEFPQALVVSKTSRKVVAEQFRILRSNLQFIINKIPNPVITITSTISSEGKSFISTNIAAAMALAGKKTILLEFDIRKPNVLKGLKMEPSPGITNFIMGNADLDKLIVPVADIENLFVLPSGPVPPNPAELLLDPKVSELFSLLKTKFDMIVTDTAPVGLVSDTQAISPYADCTLYVLRQGRTLKKHVQIIEDLYNKNKLPKMALIINDVKADSGFSSYGGQYGEKNSYFENEQAPSGFKKILRAINPINRLKK